MTAKAIENVMAVPSKSLRVLDNRLADANFSGFIPMRPKVARERLAEFLAGGGFAPRTPELERDESLAQVIGYGVLVRAGKVFVYRRGKGGGEKRLDAKLSVGVGGHWKHSDSACLAEPRSLLGLKYSLTRELIEEVRYPLGPAYATTVGVVYDGTEPVGRVHVGAVMLVRCRDDFEPVCSDEVDPVGWFAPPFLADAFNNLEGWSSLVVPHLAGLLEVVS